MLSRFFPTVVRVEAQEVAILEFLIALRKDLMSKLDDLKADVADYHTKVSAKLEEIKAELEAAKAAPAGVTDADLQSVIDMIDAAKAELVPPVAPAPAPAPEPAPAQ